MIAALKAIAFVSIVPWVVAVDDSTCVANSRCVANILVDKKAKVLLQTRNNWDNWHNWNNRNDDDYYYYYFESGRYNWGDTPWPPWTTTNSLAMADALYTLVVPQGRDSECGPGLFPIFNPEACYEAWRHISLVPTGRVDTYANYEWAGHKCMSNSHAGSLPDCQNSKLKRSSLRTQFGTIFSNGYPGGCVASTQLVDVYFNWPTAEAYVPSSSGEERIICADRDPGYPNPFDGGNTRFGALKPGTP